MKTVTITHNSSENRHNFQIIEEALVKHFGIPENFMLEIVARHIWQQVVRQPGPQKTWSEKEIQLAISDIRERLNRIQAALLP